MGAPQIDSSGTHIVSTGDFQTLHLGLEGGALQPEASGGAIRSGDCAFGLPEHVKDVLALSILQTVIRVRDGGAAFGAHFRNGNMQGSAAAENDGAFHQILEFTNVPGPRPCGQRVHRFLGNGFDLSFHAKREFAYEVADQQGDILAPFAQRRHADGKTLRR